MQNSIMQSRVIFFNQFIYFILIDFVKYNVRETTWYPPTFKKKKKKNADDVHKDYPGSGFTIHDDSRKYGELVQELFLSSLLQCFAVV